RFRGALVRRPEVQGLADLVEVREDARVEVGHSPFDEGHVLVELRMRDGSAAVRRVEQPVGSAARPLSSQQLRAKYRDCARSVLEEPAMDRSLAALEALESLPTVAELVEQLTPSPLAGEV